MRFLDANLAASAKAIREGSARDACGVMGNAIDTHLSRAAIRGDTLHIDFFKRLFDTGYDAAQTRG